MTTIQSITGLFLLVFGTFFSFSAGNLPAAFISLVGGFILMSLSKLVDLQQAAYLKALGLPVTGDQLHLMMKYSPEYAVESADFNVYPGSHKEYALIRLEGELYLSVQVFKNVMTQEENEYTFRFPGREPISFHRTLSLYKGAELFEYGGLAFVSISALNLVSDIREGRLLLNFAVRGREADN
ncbi:hypothetical protein P4H65_01185 [Paenibacillus chitinolyticus]|uniref:hypothetical protein n=1 Tax=Paenibacillus chitinolyticus TaxID=79263 RepID=UPI002DBD1CBB|nr:hypothetical protein [Paenibacillus chitinolyticus]MEC0244429.1 hypothetical protein [Paenibacillus chitinolyticus]